MPTRTGANARWRGRGTHDAEGNDGEGAHDDAIPTHILNDGIPIPTPNPIPISNSVSVSISSGAATIAAWCHAQL